MNKKDAVAVSKEENCYQNVLCDLILTQFDLEIKYDYPIPPVCDVLEIVSRALEDWKTKSKLKEDLVEISREDECVSYSEIREYLWREQIFGREQFSRCGEFFRYRKEEKANAISRTFAHKKLSNKKRLDEKSSSVSFKKDTQEFVDLLNKNIKIFCNNFLALSS